MPADVRPKPIPAAEGPLKPEHAVSHHLTIIGVSHRVTIASDPHHRTLPHMRARKTFGTFEPAGRHTAEMLPDSSQTFLIPNTS